MEEQARRRDRMGEDEPDAAPEADPAVPERRAEWHVPDRANEADDRDERADDDVLERRPEAVAADENLPPDVRRDENREDAGDDVAERHLLPQHLRVGQRVARG